MAGFTKRETTLMMEYLLETALAVDGTSPQLQYEDVVENFVNNRYAIQDLTGEQICEKFNYILHEEIHHFPEIPVADMMWVLYVFNKKTISWEYQQIMKQKRMLSVDHKGQHYKIMLKDDWRHFALRFDIPRDVEDEFETNWEDARDEIPEQLEELDEPADMDDPEQIPMNAPPNPDDDILENVSDQQNLLEEQHDREDESASTSGNDEMEADNSQSATHSKKSSNSGESSSSNPIGQNASIVMGNDFKNDIEDRVLEIIQFSGPQHSGQSRASYSEQPNTRQSSEAPDHVEEHSADHGGNASEFGNSSSSKRDDEAGQSARLDRLTFEKRISEESPLPASNASQISNFPDVEQIDGICFTTKYEGLQGYKMEETLRPANTFTRFGSQEGSYVRTAKIGNLQKETTRRFQTYDTEMKIIIPKTSKLSQPFPIRHNIPFSNNFNNHIIPVLNQPLFNQPSTSTFNNPLKSVFSRNSTQFKSPHQYQCSQPQTTNQDPLFHRKLVKFAKANPGSSEMQASKYIEQFNRAATEKTTLIELFQNIYQSSFEKHEWRPISEERIASNRRLDLIPHQAKSPGLPSSNFQRKQNLSNRKYERNQKEKSNQLLRTKIVWTVFSEKDMKNPCTQCPLCDTWCNYRGVGSLWTHLQKHNITLKKMREIQGMPREYVFPPGVKPHFNKHVSDGLSTPSPVTQETNAALSRVSVCMADEASTGRKTKETAEPMDSNIALTIVKQKQQTMDLLNSIRRATITGFEIERWKPDTNIDLARFVFTEINEVYKQAKCYICVWWTAYKGIDDLLLHIQEKHNITKNDLMEFNMLNCLVSPPEIRPTCENLSTHGSSTSLIVTQESNSTPSFVVFRGISEGIVTDRQENETAEGGDETCDDTSETRHVSTVPSENGCDELIISGRDVGTNDASGRVEIIPMDNERQEEVDTGDSSSIIELDRTEPETESLDTDMVSRTPTSENVEQSPRGFDTQEPDVMNVTDNGSSDFLMNSLRYPEPPKSLHDSADQSSQISIKQENVVIEENPAPKRKRHIIPAAESSEEPAGFTHSEESPDSTNPNKKFKVDELLWNIVQQNRKYDDAFDDRTAPPDTKFEASVLKIMASTAGPTSDNLPSVESVKDQYEIIHDLPASVKTEKTSDEPAINGIDVDSTSAPTLFNLVTENNVEHSKKAEIGGLVNKNRDFGEAPSVLISTTQVVPPQEVSVAGAEAITSKISLNNHQDVVVEPSSAQDALRPNLIAEPLDSIPPQAKPPPSSFFCKKAVLKKFRDIVLDLENNKLKKGIVKQFGTAMRNTPDDQMVDLALVTVLLKWCFKNFTKNSIMVEGGDADGITVRKLLLSLQASILILYEQLIIKPPEINKLLNKIEETKDYLEERPIKLIPVNIVEMTMESCLPILTQLNQLCSSIRIELPSTHKVSRKTYKILNQLDGYVKPVAKQLDKEFLEKFNKLIESTSKDSITTISDVFQDIEVATRMTIAMSKIGEHESESIATDDIIIVIKGVMVTALSGRGSPYWLSQIEEQLETHRLPKRYARLILKILILECL